VCEGFPYIYPSSKIAVPRSNSSGLKKSIEVCPANVSRGGWVLLIVLCCQRAKLRAGIKLTALCSAFDKENLIEFLLDSVHYLYNRSNPNPVLSPALPYESTCSRTFIDITN